MPAQLKPDFEALLRAERMPEEIQSLQQRQTPGHDHGLKIVPLESKFANDYPDSDGETEDAWAERANLKAFGRTPQANSRAHSHSFAASAASAAFPEPVTLGNAPTATWWQEFGQAVHSLPASYPKPHRAFLEALGDTGDVSKAMRHCGIKSKSLVYLWLKRFAEWRAAHPEEREEC